MKQSRKLILQRKSGRLAAGVASKMLAMI